MKATYLNKFRVTFLNQAVLCYLNKMLLRCVEYTSNLLPF